MVSEDRWCLYGGALVQLKWTISQPAVVSIVRWTIHVQLQVVFKTNITVRIYVYIYIYIYICIV